MAHHLLPRDRAVSRMLAMAGAMLAMLGGLHRLCAQAAGAITGQVSDSTGQALQGVQIAAA